MGGKCSPSGGINNMFGGTRIQGQDADRSGKPNSRTDLYPDENHQKPDDRITSRWYDDDGWAIWDRDYTDHGWPEAHPVVPHDHPFRWRYKSTKPERQAKWLNPSADYCG